ncbi:protein kinase domain-containing protein [Actinophytocola gossypii]|uniref:mitogen-activated protein kinase kinase n=1 Tax=Actinophytocola gossypii TaxID=2812003 RepID=A0ABT2JEC7_9PSEU|nr:protein kinase [Actinophytocola gossypii]MCT2585889.1 protein kinase [Actinophytocola gossypii]
MATINSAELNRIGDGPVATVYSGQRAGVPVAWKVFPKRPDKRTLTAYNKEQAKLSAVRGVSSILPVDGVDELDTGELAVRMELCTQSLAALVDRVGQLPHPDVVVLGRAVALALATAHESGVVHGGISPHNILFRRTGEPVLADFGVTLRHAFARDPLYAIEFLPPETLRTGELNPSTDLYGLGAVLHYALSGRSPHPGRLGEQPGERVLRILGEPVPAINAPNVPVGLSTLVARLLATDPTRRPEDTRAVADQLADMLPDAPPRPATDDFDDFDGPQLPPPPPPPPAPSRPLQQPPPPQPTPYLSDDFDDFDDFAVAPRGGGYPAAPPPAYPPPARVTQTPVPPRAGSAPIPLPVPPPPVQVSPPAGSPPVPPHPSSSPPRATLQVPPPPAQVSPPPPSAPVFPPPAPVFPPPAPVSPPPAPVSPSPAQASPSPAQASAPPAQVSPPPAEVSSPPPEVSQSPASAPRFSLSVPLAPTPTPKPPAPVVEPPKSAPDEGDDVHWSPEQPAEAPDQAAQLRALRRERVRSVSVTHSAPAPQAPADPPEPSTHLTPPEAPEPPAQATPEAPETQALPTSLKAPEPPAQPTPPEPLEPPAQTTLPETSEPPASTPPEAPEPEAAEPPARPTPQASEPTAGPTPPQAPAEDPFEPRPVVVEGPAHSEPFVRVGHPVAAPPDPWAVSTPTETDHRKLRYDLVAGAGLLLLVLGFVLVMALRSEPEGLEVTAREPASTDAASSDVVVELAEPTDLVDHVELNWTGSHTMTYAVVIAEEGKSEPKVDLVGSVTSMTVEVEPGQQYCFQIQATTSERTYESKVRALRGATCQE